MKRQSLVLIVCALACSCESDSVSMLSSNTILGFWSRETVYLDGVNSNEYVDFLNGGTNFLHIKKDKTFARAYDNGSWNLSGRTLMLDRVESGGFIDWKYKIVETSANLLVLEMNLTAGQYCCAVDAFEANEVITVREVYKRVE